MPKELRKRGRRAAEARKKEREEQEEQYVQLAEEQGFVPPAVDEEGDVDMEGGWEGEGWEGMSFSFFSFFFFSCTVERMRRMGANEECCSRCG